VRPVLALLVDAPESGVVLPELAAEVGSASARRLYRVLLRRWLGEEADLRPQASGAIGARAAAAVAGTNLPDGWLVLLRLTAGVDAALLRRAATVLEDRPFVLGAASDGGVYLLGGRLAPPPMLRALTDAGPGALAQFRTALDESGTLYGELPVRRAIVSAADARAERLLT
jgi:glycosyltransferase A (GT-A) superfamily protein (DUF2064 family)